MRESTVYTAENGLADVVRYDNGGFAVRERQSNGAWVLGARVSSQELGESIAKRAAAQREEGSK